MMSIIVVLLPKHLRTKVSKEMNRNEQEMQFADPAWQPVPHGSTEASDGESPLLFPVDISYPGWENESKEPQMSEYASSFEQGYQGQVPVVPLGQKPASAHQKGMLSRPRRWQQSGLWLIAMVFGIWLIL